MTKRSARRTSARGQRTVKRGDEPVVEKAPEKPEGNWFQRQTANNKVYYTKLTYGVLVGVLVGLLYEVDLIRGNWFLFPIIGVLVVPLVARYVYQIQEDELNNLKLFLWAGTISMFISFIFTSSLMWMVLFPRTYSL